MEGGKYKEIVPVDGKFRCEQLGLQLGYGADTIEHLSQLEQPDTFPRFFYYDGRLAPTPYEAQIDKTEAERQRAEAERLKADAAVKQASEATTLNAALLAELEMLKAKLTTQTDGSPNADRR